jgi:hypothetical protein
MTRLRACWATQRPSGLVRTSDVLDPPGRERDEEQDVDPLEERGLDGQDETLTPIPLSSPTILGMSATTSVLAPAPA